MNSVHLFPDGVFAHRVQPLFPPRLLGLLLQFVWSQGTTDGSRLLGSQIQGLEFLAFVEFTQVLLLCLMDDR